MDALPTEMLVRILSRAGWRSTVEAGRSCRLWRAAAQDPALWRELYEQRWPGSGAEHSPNRTRSSSSDTVTVFANSNGFCSRRSSNSSRRRGDGDAEPEPEPEPDFRELFQRRHAHSCCVCDADARSGARGARNEPLCEECYRNHSLVLREYDV